MTGPFSMAGPGSTRTAAGTGAVPMNKSLIATIDDDHRPVDRLPGWPISPRSVPVGWPPAAVAKACGARAFTALNTAFRLWGGGTDLCVAAACRAFMTMVSGRDHRTTKRVLATCRNRNAPGCTPGPGVAAHGHDRGTPCAEAAFLGGWVTVLRCCEKGCRARLL